MLGLWIAAAEGAKFYTSVVTELKNRGLHDILIASVDGLKRFLGVIEEVYPAGELQLWPVHMMRNSLNFGNRKKHKQVANDLRKVYKAVTFDNASAALEAFPLKWEQQSKS